jgi:hypothetical protein
VSPPAPAWSPAAPLLSRKNSTRATTPLSTSPTFDAVSVTSVPAAAGSGEAAREPTVGGGL